MYKYTENLDGWESMRESDMCYLPGNYFYKVFARYPGLLTHPLYIRILADKKREGLRKYVDMRQSNVVNTQIPGLLRVVIDTGVSKHSNLLILDYQNGIVYRFEPLGRAGPYFAEINEVIEDYLNAFFNFDLEVIDVEIDDIHDEKNPLCRKSGYCAAYSILYGYSFLNQKPFSPTHIRRFVSKIIQTYGTIPVEQHEVEMANPDTGRNVAIGAVAGGALGGLAFGVPGLIGGSLLGAGTGAILS